MLEQYPGIVLNRYCITYDLLEGEPGEVWVYDYTIGKEVGTWQVTSSYPYPNVWDGSLYYADLDHKVHAMKLTGEDMVYNSRSPWEFLFLPDGFWVTVYESGKGYGKQFFYYGEPEPVCYVPDSEGEIYR